MIEARRLGGVEPGGRMSIVSITAGYKLDYYLKNRSDSGSNV
jgi:hypothetical protein